jgi:hypothetical protein
MYGTYRNKFIIDSAMRIIQHAGQQANIPQNILQYILSNINTTDPNSQITQSLSQHLEHTFFNRTTPIQDQEMFYAVSPWLHNIANIIINQQQQQIQPQHQYVRHPGMAMSQPAYGGAFNQNIGMSTGSPTYAHDYSPQGTNPQHNVQHHKEEVATMGAVPEEWSSWRETSPLNLPDTTLADYIHLSDIVSSNTQTTRGTAGRIVMHAAATSEYNAIQELRANMYPELLRGKFAYGVTYQHCNTIDTSNKTMDEIIREINLNEIRRDAIRDIIFKISNMPRAKDAIITKILVSNINKALASFITSSSLEIVTIDSLSDLETLLSKELQISQYEGYDTRITNIVQTTFEQVILQKRVSPGTYVYIKDVVEGVLQKDPYVHKHNIEICQKEPTQFDLASLSDTRTVIHNTNTTIYTNTIPVDVLTAAAVRIVGTINDAREYRKHTKLSAIKVNKETHVLAKAFSAIMSENQIQNLPTTLIAESPKFDVSYRICYPLDTKEIVLIPKEVSMRM